jgi:hypothetical protein
LLITIPPGNDRLVLRLLDVDEALDRTGSNQLMILSSPAEGGTRVKACLFFLRRCKKAT